MSNESIFTKIIKREIPAEFVYEDEFVIGIKDIAPQAATHLLFIHRHLTENINEMVRTSPEQVNHLFRAIEKYTEESGLEKAGFRVVTIVEQRPVRVFFTLISMCFQTPKA